MTNRMPRACILTDSTAQFTDPAFLGRGLIDIIPFQVQWQTSVYRDTHALATGEFPASAWNGNPPQALPPEPAEYLQTWNEMWERFGPDMEIVTILSSSQLSAAVGNAQLAAESGMVSVQVIDSGTIGPGLGLLVQDAARAARQGFSASEVRHLINNRINHTYTAFCVRGLSYLQRAGQLDPAQATVGEMLGITSFMLLENGTLVHQHKVHNTHQMIDLFHEFVAEFTEPQHISVLHESPIFSNEVSRLRERLHNTFPKTPFSEHRLGAVLASILGPTSLGLVVTE